MSSASNQPPPIGNFTQPVLPIGDPPLFAAVRSAIEAAFANGRVELFFKSLDRKKIRIRNFEAVLTKGLLGPAIEGDYGKLANGDQGQIREFYLRSLEQVAPELRQRFPKLYAYY